MTSRNFPIPDTTGWQGQAGKLRVQRDVSGRAGCSTPYPLHFSEDPRSPFLTVTVATGRGSLTFTNPTQASKFVELLTSTGQNAVITWRHGDHIEERAVVHGVAHSDLAIQRLEIETVMDPDSQSALVLICRSLRMEGPPALV